MQFFGYYGKVQRPNDDAIEALSLWVRREHMATTAHMLGHIEEGGNIVFRGSHAVPKTRTITQFKLDKIINLEPALAEKEYKELVQIFSDYESGIETRKHNVRLQNWISVKKFLKNS